MKRILLSLSFVICHLAMSSATAQNDTTVVYHGKQVVISEDSLETHVSILSSDGTQWKKSKESTFVSNQEVERFYVSSPIFSWGTSHRYTPTTPRFYIGFAGFSGSALGLGSTNGMPVKTWRSSEMGVNFLEGGAWLNKRNTWSLSISENTFLSQFKLDNHSILMKDEQEHTCASPTDESGVRNSRLFCMGMNIEILVKWYKYFNDPNNDRLSIGGGLSWDLYNKQINYSSYKKDSYTHAAAAEHKMRNTLDIKLHVSYDGLILYFKKAVTPLFQSGKGPKCYPFSFGMGVVL